MSTFAEFRAQLQSFWLALSRFQKFSLAAVFVATAAFLVYLSVGMTGPGYAAAFTKLAEADAGAVTAKLKEAKIPYELTDGGGTVRVPANKVYEARIQLAQAGLPQRGAVGFELFDRNTFGLSEFSQRLNYQRALEGELARTIGQMAPVESARVHLVMPKNELFVRDEKPASASVVLKLKAGAAMDGQTARAIANLVSGGVEGLTPAKVGIVDANGAVLWGGAESPTSAGDGTDAQSRYERDLEARLDTLLERLVGAGKAKTRVAASIDWDQIQINREILGNAAPRQVREIVDRSGPELVSTAGAMDPQRRETNTTYEVPKTVETIRRAPGAIKRLSIAVLLDGVTDTSTIASIRQTVEAGAGLSTERGDSLAISTLPFSRPAEPVAAPVAMAAVDTDSILNWARVGGFALLAIAVLVVGRSLIAAMATPRPGISVPAVPLQPAEPRDEATPQRTWPVDQPETAATGQTHQATPFGFLSGIEPRIIVAGLKTEQPQVIALVLSNIDAKLAAQVFVGLPGQQQESVAVHLSAMGPVSSEVVATVARLLERRLAALEARPASHSGGSSVLEEILSRVDPATKAGILERLQDKTAGLSNVAGHPEAV